MHKHRTKHRPSTSANNAYEHMLNNGTDWALTFPAGERDYKGFEHRVAINSNALKSMTLNHDEDTFVKGVAEEEMYAVHFSPSDVQSGDGITFRSRVNLQGKGIGFDAGNTQAADLARFATDDFAFFSLEVGSQPKKKTSRFGTHRYSIPLDTVLADRNGMSAHIEANDILNAPFRPVDYTVNPDKKPRWLYKKDVKKFQQPIEVNGTEATSTDLLFNAQDTQEIMALSIVKDLRNLPHFKTKKIYNAANSDDRNSIVNSFYRPQLLVPHKLKLAKDEYKYSHPVLPGSRTFKETEV